MDDDNDLYKAPPMRKFKDVAQTAFDRAQQERFEKGDEPTASPCARCFGTGWEQYTENGYNRVRKCDHLPVPF